MTQIALLYVTTPTRDAALSIGRVLVEEKLSACINILGEIQSIYRWEGTMNESKEVALLVKTTSTQTDAAIARIKALHPYACPTILTLPVSAGYAPFLDWIQSEMRS